MSDCRRVVELLSDYLERRLPDDVRADLEHHLAGCSECTAFAGSFRSTLDLLHSLTDADLPDELRLRLKAFLDRRSAN